MKRSLPPLAIEEREMFRAAVGSVRPLTGSTLPPARPRPLARRLRGASVEAPGGLAGLPFDPSLADVAEELSYVRAGCAVKLLRQLRRGHYPAQGDLDLHQMTVATAHVHLVTFLTCAKRRRWRCVRVVHGKGMRSGARGPVLKKLTDRFLRESADVLAFVSAPSALGGTGAVLVLLRADYTTSSRTTTVA